MKMLQSQSQLLIDELKKEIEDLELKLNGSMIIPSIAAAAELASSSVPDSEQVRKNAPERPTHILTETIRKSLKNVLQEQTHKN